MSIFNFPNQRIPESKKDEEWHKSHILSYMTYSASKEFMSRKKEMADLYYAAAGELSPEQKKIVCAMITERYGDNFGPQYHVYPLIETMLDQVIGDYRRRPVKTKCLVNNKDAMISKLDKKVAMISEKMLREINEELSSAIGFTPETENPEMKLPEDIEEFFQKDFRTISEEIGEDVLYQLLVVKKEKEKIYDALRHFLVGAHVWGYCNEKDGHPSIFIPHPLECICDIDDTESVQKDIQYFVWDRPMSVNEIFNTFDLTEDQKKKVENYSAIDQNENTIAKQNESHSNWFVNEGTMLRPRVVFMEWISRIKRDFLVVNIDGKEEYKILPEGYKPRKDRDEKIEKMEIENVRHVTMIGPDVVLSYGSNEQQMKTIGNPKKRFLNVIGLADYRSGIGRNRSLAKKLLYLQDFASEALYELRLNARQLDGNVLVYDLANMPKEWMSLGADKAMQKINFYLKRDRMQIINSKDKKSNAYANSTNVSQKGRMQDIMALLALIEDMASRVSGISKEAQAQAGQYQKTGVAEINMTATASRVENYYGLFDSFIETFLERMLLKAKHVYKPNDIFTFFAGDNQTKFLKIYPDFLAEDLGIHIGDNRKEFERKQRIDKAGEMAFGNSQDPMILRNMIKMWNAEHSTEAEAIFDRGLKALEAMRKENMAQTQQIEESKNQAMVEKEQLITKRHEETMQNNIDVANIYANNKIQEVVERENGQDRRKAAELEVNMMLKDKESKSDKSASDKSPSKQ